MQEGLKDIFKSVTFNSQIDLYLNDYEQLILNKEFTQACPLSRIHEILSFTDINLCKNKMLSSVSWHPFLTGIVACAYGDTSLNNYMEKHFTSDEAKKTIYSKNPVLIWSFDDALKPKLILEAHREVTSLAFCPYDSGIVVGGCRNGQVIVWDIFNKIKRVETTEVLTPNEQKYKNLMFLLMHWMKITKDSSFVPITVLSDLEYSHFTTITEIQWLPPKSEISKTGQIKKISDDNDIFSYQFVTASIDGTILFWDLKSKPVVHSGDYRPQRRLKRLKRRPSALLEEVSPLRHLHRHLKPYFKINVANEEDSKIAPISCLAMPYFHISCEELNPVPRRKFHIVNRLTFKPIFTKNPMSYPQEVCCGTTAGDFVVAHWDGYEYTSGEVVSQETAKIFNWAKYHDGPILSIARWPPNPKILLTVGGKVFCIWHEELKCNPILWRRSNVRYTHATWNKQNSSILIFTKADGNYETWNFFNKSDGPSQQIPLSGNPLTGSFAQDICIHALAIADFNGSLRICQFSESEPSKDRDKWLENWLQKEMLVKSAFRVWQDAWTKKHMGDLILKEEEVERQRKLEEENKETMKIQQELERERLEKEDEKLYQLKLRAPPGGYKEWAEKKCMEREKKRMHKVLLQLKQLDSHTLREQQKPLKKIKMEEAHKRKKQILRHKDAGKIFNDTVAMYFPHVIQKHRPPPKDPYAGGDTLEVKQRAMVSYKTKTKCLKDFITNNPFVYNFNWQGIVKAGSDRRRIIDFFDVKSYHKNRYNAVKLMEQQNESEEISCNVEENMETSQSFDEYFHHDVY